MKLVIRKSSAYLSEDRRYRYWLERWWGTGAALVVIGLNPSTADESLDDPTIRKCIGFAQRWGYAGLIMLNLFAWRSPEPKELRVVEDPIGSENDYFLEMIAKPCRRILCAWGKDGDIDDRDLAVLKLLQGRELVALKVSEKTGQPWHPLYVSYETKPVAYKGRAA